MAAKIRITDGGAVVIECPYGGCKTVYTITPNDSLGITVSAQDINSEGGVMSTRLGTFCVDSNTIEISSGDV